MKGQKKVLTSQVTREKIPSYIRADIGASYAISEGLEANFMVRNLMDKTYYTSASGPTYVNVGEPLNVTIGMNMKF